MGGELSPADLHTNFIAELVLQLPRHQILIMLNNVMLFSLFQRYAGQTKLLTKKQTENFAQDKVSKLFLAQTYTNDRF